MASTVQFFSPKALQYALQYSLREPEVLQQLREETATLEKSIMQIAPEQGQLMRLILPLINARNVIEVGVFTGYSTLCMAMAIPDDGRIIACDVSEEWTNIGRRYWQKAGLEHKIQLHLAPASETLDNLLQAGRAGTFDFAFIDADKENYDRYYEQCLQLLRSNGLIMVDNTLWSGRVAKEEENDAETVAIRALNAKIHTDDRVDISLLPMCDGITLVRKK